MNVLARIDEVFCAEIERFEASRGLVRMRDGEIKRDHYASLMRQIFHNVRENPQLQTLLAARFRGSQRDLVGPILRHALSEVGHDELALRDLRTLGYRTEPMADEHPLPATTALTAFAMHQIHNLNPIGHLGYSYFLEFMPTLRGKQYVRWFEAAGVPSDAMGFIHDHVKVDQGHNRLMHRYIEQLVRTPADLDAVCYAIKCTAYLYALMVDAAFQAADEGLMAAFT